MTKVVCSSHLLMIWMRQWQCNIAALFPLSVLQQTGHNHLRLLTKTSQLLLPAIRLCPLRRLCESPRSWWHRDFCWRLACGALSLKTHTRRLAPNRSGAAEILWRLQVKCSVRQIKWPTEKKLDFGTNIHWTELRQDYSRWLWKVVFSVEWVTE